jgi:hypothetical protein
MFCCKGQGESLVHIMPPYTRGSVFLSHEGHCETLLPPYIRGIVYHTGAGRTPASWLPAYTRGSVSLSVALSIIHQTCFCVRNPGARVKELADELCGGKCVFLLEGGYDLMGLSEVGLDKSLQLYNIPSCTQ